MWLLQKWQARPKLTIPLVLHMLVLAQATAHSQLQGNNFLIYQT